MYEPFLINPPKRKRKTTRKKRVRKAGGGAQKRRPVLYGPARGPWRRSRKYQTRKRKVTLVNRVSNPALAMIGNKPRRRRQGSYRRNPAMTLGNITGQFGRILPLAVTGIASGVVVNMVPGFLNLANPWMNHGAKAAIALVGGPMVGRMIGKDHGLVWTVVGISSVVQDLIRQFMPGVIPGLGHAYPEYYDATQVGAYPNEVGAFPVDGVGDYEEGSDYLENAHADMGESPYPY